MINFPDAPALNDTYTVGQVTYQWDGVKWVVKSNHTHAIADVATLQGELDTLASNINTKANIAGQTFTGNVTVPSLNGGPLAGFRNKIINGNFDIWQRGTSQTTSGYGSVDRWTNFHNGSTKTTSRQAFATDQTTVPGNPKFFMRTVVSSVAGASNYVQTSHAIEDLQHFSGKTITLSFWAKADAAKNIAVEFRENEADGSAALGVYFTAALTTAWQKFTITHTITTVPASVTLGANNNLAVVFWFEAGTTFVVGNSIAGNQSGTFDIAQVQLEEGPVATPFEQRPIGVELALCQRYYRNLVEPGTTAQYVLGLGQTTGTTVFKTTAVLSPPMRAKPHTLTVSNPADFTVYYSTTQLPSAIGLSAQSDASGYEINFVVPVGVSIGTSCCFYTTNVNAQIGISAEL